MDIVYIVCADKENNIEGVFAEEENAQALCTYLRDEEKREAWVETYIVK